MRWNTCACDPIKWRIALNARMIWILVAIAIGERRTLLSMAMPFSVKAYGSFRAPILMELDIANCDFHFSSSSKVANCDLEESPLDIANCDFQSSNSSFVSWNIKSSGKRSILRLTCSFKRRVSTPYSRAKSRSRMTCLPRMVRIRLSICSTGWMVVVSTFAISFFLAIILLNVYCTRSACKGTKKFWDMQIYLHCFNKMCGFSRKFS